jgi:hypothetical protein
MIENVERRPLLMTVARFVRPSRVEGGRLIGTVWNAAIGAEVEIRATMPKDLAPERALEAAASGDLVLLPSTARLGWART